MTRNRSKGTETSVFKRNQDNSSTDPKTTRRHFMRQLVDTFILS